MALISECNRSSGIGVGDGVPPDGPGFVVVANPPFVEGVGVSAGSKLSLTSSSPLQAVRIRQAEAKHDTKDNIRACRASVEPLRHKDINEPRFILVP
jgi:hypothetical protein